MIEVTEMESHSVSPNNQSIIMGAYGLFHHSAVRLTERVLPTIDNDKLEITLADFEAIVNKIKEDNPTIPTNEIKVIYAKEMANNYPIDGPPPMYNKLVFFRLRTRAEELDDSIARAEENLAALKAERNNL